MATLFAYGVAGMVTGAVFVEKIFGWHGMGEWLVQGIATQDTNIVVAITVFTGAVDPAGRPAVRRHLRRPGPEGAGVVTEPVTSPVATSAKSGLHDEAFASRRALVLRRFLRNRPAVVSLVVLVVLFVGCYALPPLLPYSTPTSTTTRCSSRRAPTHWFGTNALGQDLLALTLRGMQKSMLIGVCVALISTTIAATVGAVAGYFGGWRDRALMWIVDLLLVVPELHPDRDRHPADQAVRHRRGTDRAAGRVRLDDQFPHGARYDDEPAGPRIRQGRKVYGRAQLAHHRPPHPAERRLDPDHRHRAERRDWRSWPKPA